MKITDSAEYAYHNLRSRKLRSWLTILGIIIGVASIVTLISLANGVSQQINSRLNGLSDNIIQITPGGQRATRIGGGFGFAGGSGGSRGGFGGGGFSESQQPLTFNDASNVGRVPGVQAYDARISFRGTANLHNTNASLNLVGVDPNAFKAMAGTPMLAGRYLSPSDGFTVVLGFNVYNSTFVGQPLLNRQLNIKINNNNYAFHVVGLLNQSSGGFSVSDGSAYIPLTLAKTLSGDTNPSQIIVMTQPSYTTDDVASRIETLMDQLHHKTINNEDFTITTLATVEATISQVTDLLTLFLGGIAAISLIVGGIGVANTMFMSVLERTKEIGILKALGLKDNEITVLFLFEAAAIGLVGGVMGVLLSFGLSAILAALGVPTQITLDLVLLGLFFSAFVGIISGIIPARNASKLQPVEALRYE